MKPRSKRRSFVSASTAVVSLLAGAVLVAQQPAAMTVREQARETGSFERLIQKAAGRPHEGTAVEVFLIARHFADNH